MPNYSIKCLSCKAILFYLVLMVIIGTCPSEDNQTTKELLIAKINFLSRERDYLKAQPLSDSLRSFINRFKRRTWGFLEKNKREDELKGHMFVVHDGNIEPLENISDVTANVPSSDPSGLGNFTVIPLVIPITVKTFTNATFCDNTSDNTDESSTEWVRKSEKRTEVETEKPDDREEKVDKTEPPVPRTSRETMGRDSTTEMIVDDSVSSTKSVNMKYLNKVLTDVQQLISYEKEGKSSGSNEGAMCSVIGDWDSKAGGMQLQITARNESLHSPCVNITEQEPPSQGGFLQVGKWNTTAYMPYNHSSLIIITAISDRTVASFIGECRICEGWETITGNWMLGRRSTNCKDRQDSHSFFSDVMNKNNIRRLQKAHLDELSTRGLVTTTEL